MRFQFDVSSGPEESQARNAGEAMSWLKGLVNIADDVLIFGCGSNQAAAEADHDDNIY
jgi:hypothetical protein